MGPGARSQHRQRFILAPYADRGPPPTPLHKQVFRQGRLSLFWRPRRQLEADILPTVVGLLIITGCLLWPFSRSSDNRPATHKFRVVGTIEARAYTAATDGGSPMQMIIIAATTAALLPAAAASAAAASDAMANATVVTTTAVTTTAVTTMTGMTGGGYRGHLLAAPSSAAPSVSLGITDNPLVVAASSPRSRQSTSDYTRCRVFRQPAASSARGFRRS